jgi:hypothetical protein
LKTLICVLIFASFTQAQNDSAPLTLAATRLKASVSISKKTSWVSCWDKTNKLTGSRLVRSPLLVSPTKSQRAYVEVEATAFQPKDLAQYIGPLCENVSRLFFAASEQAKYTLKFSQSQEDFSDGNSLTLVDWSPDGRLLLLARTQWKYESEGDYTDFVIFDADSGKTWRPDLEAAIAATYGNDCGSDNSVLGFTSDGNVVLALAPLTDQVALMNGAKSCVKQRTLFSLNITGGVIANMATTVGNLKIVHYGRFIAPSATRR